MFKAMAAANGQHDDETDGEVETRRPTEDVAELEPDDHREAYVDAEDDELEDEDFDESDEDE